ncbi:hypothetical protein [Armatimonas rosea]|uniref:Uncharacterized protein n=1 Tax=Armatimonas rosea TaxID=685828 RepID=A0A7W9SUY8_ARMRO|nr:hypothetical protein [Armatimonas rosea]MBB6053306.1 hypothetical protein [Armatimonas rosea]
MTPDQPPPDPATIRRNLRVLEAELEADARLAQLRERFGIEPGEPLSFPLFSPVLDRSDGLAVRRVWCGRAGSDWLPADRAGGLTFTARR